MLQTRIDLVIKEICWRKNLEQRVRYEHSWRKIITLGRKSKTKRDKFDLNVDEKWWNAWVKRAIFA